MTRHDPMQSLRDMLDYAKKAIRFSEGKSREDLEDDDVLMLALSRAVEIVGEAANRIPCEVQQQYPTIPWPSVIGMRHRLIHGYDLLDVDVLWDTIEDDLPPLITELEKIVG